MRSPTGTNPPDFKQLFATLEEVFTNDLIPFIDANYRTRPPREFRALAGLSMGGLQTFIIGLAQSELFGSLGGFMGGFMGGFSGAGGGFGDEAFDAKTAHDGAMDDAHAFNTRWKTIFLSIGTHENEFFYSSVKNYRAALENAGIKTLYYESPGPAHEWQTWRRSLREFAPLLF